MDSQRVFVIVPATNEGREIHKVLDSLGEAQRAKVISGYGVIANGCTDGGETAAIAKSMGAEVLVQEKANKGAACIGGINHFKGKADVFVFLDADLERFSPEKITMLVKPLLLGEAEMSIASVMFGPAAFCKIWFSGQRAITKKALMPVLAGNRRWIRALSQGKGFEVALNTLIKRLAFPEVRFETKRPTTHEGFFRNMLTRNQIAKVIGRNERRKKRLAILLDTRKRAKVA